MHAITLDPEATILSAIHNILLQPKTSQTSASDPNQIIEPFFVLLDSMNNTSTPFLLELYQASYNRVLP